MAECVRISSIPRVNIRIGDLANIFTVDLTCAADYCCDESASFVGGFAPC